ncbi:AGL064Wp [Eremothecium gossypii ATCC 10895]|uniref:AGL064Wp n=1 Tax=Eremothecium gossypii (strain ATCC 10895 / CBS 109.51 / FGSC 9923 / NRRL Y-1056) TaxID=284811 RepID=Q750M1_EREGS|nr:AGL064Wp [Eremothecium gossypii ATCC 10895]AAS54426.1 AGL064Wp [Eremothecium gossypii ATCC 10895]AEY98758.1 FAGL064Wp [Eremothecium gossypii FDAG1]
MARSREGADAARSFVAGAAAGAIEGCVTYPFEFAKTRLQLAQQGSGESRNPLVLLYRTARTQGAGALYVGCPAFVVGNTCKAGVRFLGFDALRRALQDERGALSGPRGMLAGLGAGLLESVLAVTPFEAVKTALIDDRQAARPRYQHNGRGAARNYALLLRELGLRGLYGGLVPVALRQASNQAVRFGCYTQLKQAVQRYAGTPADQPLGSGQTFLVGALSGIVTVYATMPVDTVKTRMQALDAARYGSTVGCFRAVVREEGVRALWRGATPRLGRLVLSGGIVFTAYEKLLVLLP